MKITICGSMSFAKEMLTTKKKLDGMGHKAFVPVDARVIAEGKHDHDDLEEDYRYCIENDIMRKCYALIEKSDAVIVLNYPKNGVDGYVGAATLMDMGIAYYLGKRIFLLNPPPGIGESRQSHEIRAMQPIVLAGSLEKLRQHA